MIYLITLKQDWDEIDGILNIIQNKDSSKCEFLNCPFVNAKDMTNADIAALIFVLHI